MTPTGPLRLAGYSLGGCPAYAVALAMTKKGRSVEFVALLDAWWSPARVRLAPKSRGRSMEEISRKLAGYLGRHPKLLWLLSGLRRPLKLLRPIGGVMGVPLPGRDDVLMQRLLDLWQEWCCRELRSLSAPVFLFRADNSSEDYGWSEHCPNLAITPVSGDHFTMFEEPNLQTLAEVFISSAREPLSTLNRWR
jgi:thioesterase domain-containing protein